MKQTDNRSTMVLVVLSAAFCVLIAAFTFEWWGVPKPLPPIPLVDPKFLETKTWRQSYADLISLEEDVDHFDCYICHEEDKKSVLKFDANHRVIIPEEHEDIVMGHGTHGRNNDCFNCHNDKNLLLLQARGIESLKMENSTPLCGSCHGPTLRDWEAGSHGRTSGYWDRSKGPYKKQDCVNCHDPHSPGFPGRRPAPAPNHLRHVSAPSAAQPSTQH